MASLYTVLCSLQQQISSVTQGLISSAPDTTGKPLTVEVGLYWPSAKALQNNVRKGNGLGGPSALVTIYDRGLASDSTRWLPVRVGQAVTAATMTVALSSRTIPPLGSVTVTFGGTISPGDAVGVVLASVLGQNCAVVPIAVAGDTPMTMASQLAAMVNTNADLGTHFINTLVLAVVAGPVVTLTSVQPHATLAITANVGNGGTQSIEIGRRKRHFQIVIWCRTPDDRNTVSDPIEVLIAQLESVFGLTFPDGTMGRMTYYGDIQHDEATLSDILRRDLMVCVDYGINTTNATYAVLAPIVQFTTL